MAEAHEDEHVALRSAVENYRASLQLKLRFKCTSNVEGASAGLGVPGGRREARVATAVLARLDTHWHCALAAHCEPPAAMPAAEARSSTHDLLGYCCALLVRYNVTC